MSDLDTKLNAYDRELEWLEALENKKVSEEEYNNNHKLMSLSDFLKTK